MHADLHAGNVFLHGGKAKLGDFGGLFSSSEPLSYELPDNKIYHPPCVANYSIPALDAWSAAVMLYQLFYGKPPLPADPEGSQSQAYDDKAWAAV